MPAAMGMAVPLARWPMATPPAAAKGSQDIAQHDGPEADAVNLRGQADDVDEDEGGSGDETENAAIGQCTAQHESDIAALAQQTEITAQGGIETAAAFAAMGCGFRQDHRGQHQSCSAIDGEDGEI